MKDQNNLIDNEKAFFIFKTFLYVFGLIYIGMFFFSPSEKIEEANVSSKKIKENKQFIDDVDNIDLLVYNNNGDDKVYSNLTVSEQLIFNNKNKKYKEEPKEYDKGYEILSNFYVESNVEKAIKNISNLNTKNIYESAWIGILYAHFYIFFKDDFPKEFAAKAKHNLKLFLDKKNNKKSVSACMLSNVYSYLGMIYLVSEKWPNGFGNDDLGESYLVKALKKCPTNRVSLMFYGQYKEKEDKMKSLLIYKKAKNFPIRSYYSMIDNIINDKLNEKISSIEYKIKG